MLRWIARAGMLRFLGRRAIPALAAWEVFQLVRGMRRGSNDRPDSTTGSRRR